MHIHAFHVSQKKKTWQQGSSPTMLNDFANRQVNIQSAHLAMFLANVL
jgi:hypothetical protein